MRADARPRPTGATTRSAHSPSGRNSPSFFRHDYLVLRLLGRDIRRALELVARAGRLPRVALDVGAGGAPYRATLEQFGYTVRSLDLEAGAHVDIVGSAEATGLPDASIDLVFCTQVLEHTRAPWLAMREFARVLRPGGSVVLSVPHVWFHHPHPHDYWRMTSEGMEALCEEGGFRAVAVLPQGGSALCLFQVVNFLAYGVLGGWGAPFYAALNLCGRAADAVLRDTRFSLNHVCVGVKATRLPDGGSE